MERKRHMRLPGFDYTRPGAYFVTICTLNRLCLLGEVVDGCVRLSEAGGLARDVWENLPSHYPHVRLDAWVIMPNHLHGIVCLAGTEAASGGVGVGTGLKPVPTGGSAPRYGLPEVIRAFKTFSAKRINASRGAPGVPFWQRSYHDRIIRDDASLDRLRQYVIDNPARWHQDPNNPAIRTSAAGVEPD